MGKETGIQWCDSSTNLQAGCEGCELVKGQEINKCYAKTLTDRYAGRKGWPDAFEKPKIFMERIPAMLSMPDLTGKDRPDKPWLNGLPRLIFLNDMGDTFSGGMPKDWFAEVLPKIMDSPHQYLVLSKWANRFADFTTRFALPPNIWAGTSITNKKTLFRLRDLKRVQGPNIKWLSIEPLWEDLELEADDLDGISWVVVGGESGTSPTPCEKTWIEKIVFLCQAKNIPVFVKQVGTYMAKEKNRAFRTKQLDGHGGNWEGWPIEWDAIRRREMPRRLLK